MILGIDEVGRGPWAGPLVIGAVVLPEGHTIQGLTDSKKLSAKRRRELNEEIRMHALGFGLGWVHADELDEIGLSAALKKATVRAVEAINVPYHEIIIDGTINFLSETTKGAYVTTLPKADLLIPAVSAASILAKVARDAYMEKQDTVYPEYGFKSHVGYGTAQHATALQKYGVTPLHRSSFAPIKKLLGSETKEGKAVISKKLSSKMIGDAAEEQVAHWLEAQGFAVIARNWKTKWCEIDCIAEKSELRYYVEVKYRSSSEHGGAIAAITPTKLKKMRFAADLFEAKNPTAKGLRLAAAIVDSTGNIQLIEID